jgi:DNA polymerase-3 subunit delta'
VTEASTPDGTGFPAPSLYDAVVGQPQAVGQLRAAASRPVHAYQFHGPPGSGKREAGRAFAASLLCPRGGCGECNDCRRALAGIHPDLAVIERTGASLDVDEARTIVSRAQRRPLEAKRQVLLVADVHLADKAAPALLKTVEEPPPTTVFVLLADDLPASLATIASRCVQVAFDPIPADVVAQWLVAHGVDEDVARSVAAVSGGRLDRARLLATDPEFAHRQEQWRTVPSRLDGTGASAAIVASELLASAEGSLGPLQDQQAAELATLAEQAESMGRRGVTGRKDIEERHRREARRLRTDELRMGLATLAGAYRDRLVAGSAVPETRRTVLAMDALDRTAEALVRNPNEALLLESLMVTLSGMEAP